MNDYLSRKLKTLSALLILMVLYIHTFYTEGESFLTLGRIEKVIGGGLCSVAVPLFYIISGYLFFLKIPEGMKSISSKLRKRCRTLLIPYLVSNVLTFLFYAVLNVIAWKVSAINNIVNFKVLDGVVNEGLWPTIKLVFIDPPIAFQLWFVRDLMVVMFFSPILYWILKEVSSSKWSAWALGLVLAIAFVYASGFPFIVAVVWFSLGGLIAMVRMPLITYQPLLYALVTGSLYVCLAVSLGWDMIPDDYARFIPVIGIPAVWLGYDVIALKARGLIKSLFINFAANYTFFVYLCHEPLLNIFKKIPLLIDHSQPTLIGCYLLIPIMFYFFGCLFGAGVKRILPVFYRIYTGGR